MTRLNSFFAYSSTPGEIGQVIEASAKSVKQSANGSSLVTWAEIDVVGHFISEEVLLNIDAADVLIADITKLNFNVTFEIGFAIGRSKRVVLTKNKSINADGVKIENVGIFDTLGYTQYQNSSELTEIVRSVSRANPLDTEFPLNQKAPVFLLETPHKTDWASRIVSRIKKARYIFRSFDPNETPRLSAYDAITQVSESYGVVVPLLGSTAADSEIHNMRGAFIAGLATGLDKPLCLIQDGDSPVPLDYRDFVNVSHHPNDVNEIIATFASEVASAFQKVEPTKRSQSQSFLKRLNLGATSAENEMRELADYYLETDQYLKALRGEAHIVVGRKGSGKSAIFLQIRDREREIDRNNNIVLDLKPDGYKLVKFKEQILSYLEEGTHQHTITAFWEYVLLLEICYKILSKDTRRHMHDHRLYEGYRELQTLYDVDGYDPVGDFSERMSGLMENISSEYQARYRQDQNVRLSAALVTEILYKHDMRKLKERLINYMGNKGSLWLLFDNLDKGWPTSGLEHEDLIIIRALIDATRKIERDFSRSGLSINTVIFLRNDVYELLVRETSDRGKEASVVLDWTDPDLLRELIRLRVVSNISDEDLDFDHAWRKIFISHYHGVESSQYLIERSLMRPRFLLNLINQCKSFAANLNHDLVDESDITKGVNAYSADLLRDIGYELVDVSGATEDILYSFIGCSAVAKEEELKHLMREFGLEDCLVDTIFKLLLWYGFLGILYNGEEPKFIYDFNYKMPLLEGIVKKQGSDIQFVINQAFWPSLMIEDTLGV